MIDFQKEVLRELAYDKKKENEQLGAEVDKAFQDSQTRFYTPPALYKRSAPTADEAAH